MIQPGRIILFCNHQRLRNDGFSGSFILPFFFNSLFNGIGKTMFQIPSRCPAFSADVFCPLQIFHRIRDECLISLAKLCAFIFLYNTISIFRTQNRSFAEIIIGKTGYRLSNTGATRMLVKNWRQSRGQVHPWRIFPVWSFLIPLFNILLIRFKVTVDFFDRTAGHHTAGHASGCVFPREITLQSFERGFIMLLRNKTKPLKFLFRHLTYPPMQKSAGYAFPCGKL